MKSLPILAIACLAALNFSFYNQKKFTPPGTVQITSNFYFDVNEVTNLSWVEYQIWTNNMYGSNSAEYKATLIDSTNWDKTLCSKLWNNAKPLTLALRDMPVVGITHEQALAFCKWRTERVKYFLSIRDKKSSIDFEYRLPTEQEWEFVSGGSAAAFNTNASDKPAANIVYTQNHVAQLLPVASFKPNVHGLWDLTGNVAEMVAEQGIAKGGSWVTAVEDCRNGKRQLYTSATAWLGFRCACVVK